MPSDRATHRGGPLGATKPPQAAARARRAWPLLVRALKIIGVNLLLLILLLIPVELWFGHWLDGPGAISMLDANPGRVEVRSSPLYPPGITITSSRNKYGFRGGPGDPAKIDALVL